LAKFIQVSEAMPSKVLSIQAQAVYAQEAAWARAHPLNWFNAYRLFRHWEVKAVEETARGVAPYPISLLWAAVLSPDQFVRDVPSIDCEFAIEFVRDCARLSEVAARSRSWPPIFEDVYHLAFAMVCTSVGTSWRSPIRPEVDRQARLFRGQRSAKWSLAAKIYRDLDWTPPVARHQEELDRRATYVATIATAVAQRWGLPSDHALAVTQHYSGEEELDAATWLVDFTFDPWTALFFATDGGSKGEVGCLYALNLGEVSDRLHGCNNPFGELALVVPEEVPRIANQYGVFVSAANPLFFDLFVPHYYRFHQSDGLVFEDNSLGVVRERIYPADDRYLRELSLVRQSASDTLPIVPVPGSLYCDPFAADVYLRLLADCWLRPKAKIWELDEARIAAVRARLPALAEFHASRQLHLPKLYAPARSLNRLYEALTRLCQQAAEREDLNLENALSCYYVHGMGSDDES
jgi:hypothetical protein